jgi:hypothetical protein
MTVLTCADIDIGGIKSSEGRHSISSDVIGAGVAGVSLRGVKKFKNEGLTRHISTEREAHSENKRPSITTFYPKVPRHTLDYVFNACRYSSFVIAVSFFLFALVWCRVD